MSETSTSTTNGPDAGTPPMRTRLSFDLDVDSCIVGAGLAGLTVALEAARMGASIAVLEGRHVGWKGSADANAARVVQNYVLIDMLANVATGKMVPEESLKWAEGQLKSIYGG